MTSSYTWGSSQLPSSRLIAALVMCIHVASCVCLLLLCDSLSTTLFLPFYEMVFGGCVVCEGGLVGGGLRPLLFALRVLFSFCTFSVYLSYIHLVWSLTISLYLLCRVRHNSYTVFGRLVHPYSSGSTLSFVCTNRRLSVVWGCMAEVTSFLQNPINRLCDIFYALDDNMASVVLVLVSLVCCFSLLKVPGRIAGPSKGSF